VATPSEIRQRDDALFTVLGYIGDSVANPRASRAERAASKRIEKQVQDLLDGSVDDAVAVKHVLEEALPYLTAILASPAALAQFDKGVVERDAEAVRFVIKSLG
jgi:hypothetical protein